MTQIERVAMPITLLLVEDELVFRQGLRAVFEPFAAHLQIVGEAPTAEDAVALAQELVPDLVLLDLRLPQRRGSGNKPALQHGVWAIEQISARTPSTRILVLSYLEETDALFAALRSGAHGYIAKSDSYDGTDLLDAIHRLLNGEVIFGPTIAECIRTYRQSEPSALVEQLTRREREVLDLLASRTSNQDIADTLVISIKTVKTHVANILAKLHLASRHEIPVYLRLHGSEPPEG